MQVRAVGKSDGEQRLRGNGGGGGTNRSRPVLLKFPRNPSEPAGAQSEARRSGRWDRELPQNAWLFLFIEDLLCP